MEEGGLRIEAQCAQRQGISCGHGCCLYMDMYMYIPTVLGMYIEDSSQAWA